MKKWIGWAILWVIVFFVVSLGVGFVRIWLNVKAEYGTAEAIQVIGEHLRNNEGRWPQSAEEMDQWPNAQKVSIDYSVTSEQLLAEPENLRNVVRPKSGKFYTYPYYERDLERLREVLQETNSQ